VSDFPKPTYSVFDAETHRYIRPALKAELADPSTQDAQVYSTVFGEPIPRRVYLMCGTPRGNS
jgi:hypothetical protein